MDETLRLLLIARFIRCRQVLLGNIFRKQR